MSEKTTKEHLEYAKSARTTMLSGRPSYEWALQWIILERRAKLLVECQSYLAEGHGSEAYLLQALAYCLLTVCKAAFGAWSKTSPCPGVCVSTYACD